MNHKTLLFIGIIMLSGILVFAALDLKFTTTLSQTPATASVGNNVTFSVSFKPFGGAVNNMKITGGVDGVTIFTRTYASIAADAVRTDSFNWTATAGTHNIWFELDPAHTAGDSDYSNNKVQKSITISQGEPERPNLKVTDCKTEPTTYRDGSAVLIKFKIKNTGNAQALAPSYFDIRIDAVQHSQTLLPAMGPGWEGNYSFNYTVKVPSKVTIFVDSTSVILESDEIDNICSIKFGKFKDMRKSFKTKNNYILK